MPPLADNSTLRLTMILSGAISLGAYEAGVVSQIAYALDKWNAGRPNDPPLVVIDLISGASAGAMTGAMLAAHIMQGADPEAFVNANLDAWCGPAISFDQEVKMERGDKHSFLSSQRLDEVGVKDFQTGATDPQRIRQSELIYTCTVTSLDPIPFQYSATTSQKDDKGNYVKIGMLSTTQRDWVTFSIASDGDSPIIEVQHGHTRATTAADHATGWDRLRWFAVASGAFPVAWQPVVLSRHRSDYPPPWDALPEDFCLRYSDGGTLNNLPLDRAAEALGSMQDLNPDEERAYVIIQPDPTPPEYKATMKPFVELGQRDGQTPVTQVLGSIYDALREQSFDKDLYGSQKVNLRLEAREKYLPWAIKIATMAVQDVAAVEQEVRQQLDDFLDSKGSRRSADEAVERYKTRMRSEGAVKKTIDSLPEDRKNLFLLNVVLADCIADLEDHFPIRIERIFPEQADTLAGRKLGHFGGFLRPDLMRYDFTCGLRDAFRWLFQSAQARGWPEPASVIQEMNLQIDPEAERLATTPWEHFPTDLKEHFFDLVIQRGADFLADETNAGFIGHKSLDGAAHLLEVYLKFTMGR